MYFEVSLIFIHFGAFSSLGIKMAYICFYFRALGIRHKFSFKVCPSIAVFILYNTDFHYDLAIVLSYFVPGVICCIQCRSGQVHSYVWSKYTGLAQSQY